MSPRSPGRSIIITSTLRPEPSTPVSTRRKTHPIFVPQPAKNSAGHTSPTIAPPIARQSPRGRDSTDPEDGFPPAVAPDRRVGRLLARADGAGSAGAGSFHLEPTIQNSDDGASGGKQPGAPAGRQYRSEAQRAGRMA